MKKTYITFIVSAVLFAALFLGTFQDRTDIGEKAQVQIVTFGDSVFGEVRDETAVPALIEQLTGMTVFNSALGGTSAARLLDDKRMDHVNGGLSLIGLAKAVYAGDFGVQQSGTYRKNATEYFPAVIEQLETVDFDKVEIILIQHGVNDYHAGVPIENPEDPYDEYTFLGALRTGVELFRKVNPDVRVVLVTPSYAWYIFTGVTCEQQDNGGGFLEDYVNAEIAFAKEMGLEVIDLYHDFLPCENWEDYALYTYDGLHPNEEGRKLWAEKIARELAD